MLGRATAATPTLARYRFFSAGHRRVPNRLKDMHAAESPARNQTIICFRPDDDAALPTIARPPACNTSAPRSASDPYHIFRRCVRSASSLARSGQGEGMRRASARIASTPRISEFLDQQAVARERIGVAANTDLNQQERAEVNFRGDFGDSPSWRLLDRLDSAGGRRSPATAIAAAITQIGS